MQAAAAAGGYTITEKYCDQGALVNMLTRIGVTTTSRRKLIEDDFTNM